MQTLFSSLIAFALHLLALLKKPAPVPKPPLPAPTPVPEPAPPEKPVLSVPAYDWSSPIAIRHTIRVIADEEGLTVEQKNNLCATIFCESAGFNIHATHPNYIFKDGIRTLASTDWGLCQWNDYWHGKEISPEDALHDPEKAVRLMCKYFKQGLERQWVCYSTGMYKKYL